MCGQGVSDTTEVPLGVSGGGGRGRDELLLLNKAKAAPPLLCPPHTQLAHIQFLQ